MQKNVRHWRRQALRAWGGRNQVFHTGCDAKETGGDKIMTKKFYQNNSIYSGGCLCRKIRYQLSGKPSFPHFCSCDDCQRWSGAPVVAWVDFPRESLVWLGTGGKPSIIKSSEQTSRGFCSSCGSSLSAWDNNSDSDSVSITISTMDDPNMIIPKSHSYPKMAPKWLVVKAKVAKRKK